MAKVELLILDDDLKAYPNPSTSVIPEFKAILDRGRAKAVKDFAYIFHIADHASPYANGYVDVYDRQKAVAKAIFHQDNYTPDEEILKAIEVYKQLTKTPMVLLLESANVAILKLRDYFMELDFTDIDEKSGRMINDPKKVSDTIKGLGGLVESVRKLEEEVAKDTVGTSNRSGIQTDEFSQ